MEERQEVYQWWNPRLYLYLFQMSPLLSNLLCLSSCLSGWVCPPYRHRELASLEWVLLSAFLSSACGLFVIVYFVTRPIDSCSCYPCFSPRRILISISINRLWFNYLHLRYLNSIKYNCDTSTGTGPYVPHQLSTFTYAFASNAFLLSTTPLSFKKSTYTWVH